MLARVARASDSQIKLAAIVAVVTVGFVVADLICARTSHITLDPRSYVEFAKVMMTFAAIFVVLLLVERRIANDRSRTARLIAHSAESIRSLTTNACLFVPLGFASVYFMYMAAATDKPLMDQTLAVLDAAIGFNWRAFLDLTNSHPLAAKILIFAYHSLGPQLPLLFLWLAFFDRQRLTEFMAMLAVSSALTAALMSFVPAAGAYAYFQPIAADFSNFTARAGMWHFAELTKIRAGEPFSLLVTRAEGLVTFPSYHTALGIMVVYALRNIRVVAWPIGILNAIMIVSTLPEGGHHLIDVIAGAAVGVATIVAVRMVDASPRGEIATPAAYPLSDA